MNFLIILNNNENVNYITINKYNNDLNICYATI